MPLSIHRTNVLFQVLIPRIALRPRIDNASVQLVVNYLKDNLYATFKCLHVGNKNPNESRGAF